MRSDGAALENDVISKNLNSMNTFGKIFRISIFGESHGMAIGVTIDGCPAGLSITQKDFIKDLERRNPHISGTTARKEADIPKIISGIFNGRTTGAPITILFENTDINSTNYEIYKDIPRPGHADFTAMKKFGGYNDYRGSGHFSGRLTLGIVAAGVIAKKFIKPTILHASLIEAGGTAAIESAVKKAIKENDSIGGIVQCTAKNVPVGLGEPFFDSVESLLSHIIFSIPAVKGIEFGAGFNSAKMKGSEYNDIFIAPNGKTLTNNSGGINGGISNGNDLIFRVAVKPTASIRKTQRTLNFNTGKMVDLEIKGRHDTCIALRMPVIIESATAIVLADLKIHNEKFRSEKCSAKGG